MKSSLVVIYRSITDNVLSRLTFGRHNSLESAGSTLVTYDTM